MRKLILFSILILVLGTSIVFGLVNGQKVEKDCGMTVEEWIGFTIPHQQSACERMGGKYILINFYDEERNTPIITGFCSIKFEVDK